jgi:hypothetical protein
MNSFDPPVAAVPIVCPVILAKQLNLKHANSEYEKLTAMLHRPQK